MESLKTWLKGHTAEGILGIVSNKVDMYKEGLKVDKMLDKALGKGSSERIQRGTVTTLFVDFLKGLWAENPESLAVYFEQEAIKIRKEL
jgi:hypothetical protein